MPDLPNSLALTTIADDAEIIASDHRNNYSAIQTCANGLITALSGGTSGQFLRATDTDTVAMATPPGYAYSHDEYTSNVSVTATTEGTANTVVTSSSTTFDGSTAIMVEFFAPVVRTDTGAAGRNVALWLYQDGSSVGQLSLVTTSAAALLDVPVRVARRLTPASGARTYSVRASVSAGTGTVFGGVGGSGAIVPGFIRITKA